MLQPPPPTDTKGGVTEEKLGWRQCSKPTIVKKSYFSKYYKIYDLEKIHKLGKGSCK